MNTSAVFKSILFTIFMPGTLVVVIPYLLLIAFSNKVNLGIFRYVGLLIILLGAFFYIASVASFINLGGTPQIFFMKRLEKPFGIEPNKLARQGIYTFSRNPMYSGVVLIILGESIFLQSLFILVEVIVLFFIFSFVVQYIEEPHLKEVHGQEYADYLKSTPRWLGFKRNKT